MPTVTIPQTERRGSGQGQLTMAMFGRRLSWASVVAGALTAVLVEIILGALGTGTGATTVHLSDGTPSGFGLSAALWFGISSLIAMFAGGWMAGRLSGIPTKTEGALHGVLTAGLSTIFVLYLLTTAVGVVFGGAASFFSDAPTSAQNVNLGRPNIFEGTARDLQNVVGDRTQFYDAFEEDDTASTATHGYLAFIFLLLGSAAAAIGGRMSAPKTFRVRAS